MKVPFWCSHLFKNYSYQFGNDLHRAFLSRATTGKMRFVQFEWSGRKGVGVEVEDGGDVVDVTEADPSVPHNMRDFIDGGHRNLLAAQNAVNSGHFVLKREKVKIIAPITNPEKLLCIGMNYIDHCKEQDCPIPEEPVVFSKFNSAIIGPTDDLIYPEETKQLDWEVELAVVIGKTAKNVPVEKAMDYVFGFMVAHDVSARDWQFKNGGQFLLGKTMDGFCPLGPAIVMKEDLRDPHNLKMWTRVNGIVKQDSSTNQLVFKTPELITFLSRFMTLKPGDVILTGTPPGVGVFRKPPEFLKRGDIVEVEIEDIGTLRNKVV
ncbi:fumarylacetoacetate hydrolase domain-containing protein 2-like [Pomacea canaliculata]|nr:fumarylacetoacetate hydrolase domain-containing protein 2-like [Pomacea canaliculata]